MKTIKTCIFAATLCIVFLTGLASYLLISNFDRIGSNVPLQAERYDYSCNQAAKTTTSCNQYDSITEKIVATDDVSTNADNYDGLLDSIVYNVTLAVNAVNNVIATGSIFIGILTLFIGIVGLFGYHHLKEDISKYSSIYEKAEALVKSAEELKKSLSIQQFYIDKSNDSLINTAYSITNQIQDKNMAKEIIKQQLHAAQIINLYRPSIRPEDKASVHKKKQAALLYLQQNIEDEDLKHLEFVIDNDSDSDIIKQAQELALSIRMKKSPNLYPSKYKSSLGK